MASYIGTNWEEAEAAIKFLESLDVIDLASGIISSTRERGAKEAYNVAGHARYELDQASRRIEYLKSTIMREDLATLERQVQTLESRNARKRAFLNTDPEAN